MKLKNKSNKEKLIEEVEIYKYKNENLNPKRPLVLNISAISISLETIIEVFNGFNFIVTLDKYLLLKGMGVDMNNIHVYSDLYTSYQTKPFPIVTKQTGVVVLDANLVPEEILTMIVDENKYFDMVFIGDTYYQNDFDNRFFRFTNKGTFATVDRNTNGNINIKNFINKIIHKKLVLEETFNNNIEIVDYNLSQEDMDDEKYYRIADQIDKFEYTVCNNAYSSHYLNKVYRNKYLDARTFLPVIGDKLISYVDTTINLAGFDNPPIDNSEEHSHITIPARTSVTVIGVDPGNHHDSKISIVTARCKIGGVEYTGELIVSNNILKKIYMDDLTPTSSNGISDGYLFIYAHTVMSGALNLVLSDSVLVVLEYNMSVASMINKWLYGTLRYVQNNIKIIF